MPNKSKPSVKTVNDFKKRLQHYQKLLDERVDTYCSGVGGIVHEQFGEYSAEVTDAYLQILGRGGKRIRGALTMVGYEMMGGENQKMILDAALVIEMVHAYVLIVDDFQDRSKSRRGGPTVPVMLEKYQQEHHLSGDRIHTANALAWNAALFGSHAAQRLMANIDASESARIKALSILNNSLIVTVHGQTNDILNEIRLDTTESDVINVMKWKTSYYTFLNPLHTGMVLADADCTDTDAVTDYAILSGLVFQITDDILGVFGKEFESGKSPLDDIREGKRTLLSTYALEHAASSDKNFLIQMLGNEQLNELEFERCCEIFQSSGALAYATSRAEYYAEQAIASLDKEAHRWNEDSVDFLRLLTTHLIGRKK